MLSIDPPIHILCNLVMISYNSSVIMSFFLFFCFVFLYSLLRFGWKGILYLILGLKDYALNSKGYSLSVVG